MTLHVYPPDAIIVFIRERPTRHGRRASSATLTPELCLLGLRAVLRLSYAVESTFWRQYWVLTHGQRPQNGANSR